VRKLIVSEFVTLDGVMEAPGGEEGHPHTGWVLDFIGPEQNKYKLDEVLAAEALLLGRVTYEGFAGAWPQRTGVFADKMNSMPKLVASTTLQDLDWNNSKLIQGDVAEGVAKLQEQDGGEILVAGSRTLVHTLMRHGLVDEYRLMVFPVVLGSGRRLFPETPDKTVLKLVDTQPFASGVVAHTYRAGGWGAGGSVAQAAGDRLERPREARSVLGIGLVRLDLPPAAHGEALVDGDGGRVVTVLDRLASADQHGPAGTVRAGPLHVDVVLVARVVGEEDALPDVALGQLERERRSREYGGEDRERERELRHEAKLPSERRAGSPGHAAPADPDPFAFSPGS
jgi:dihydrofolate reductase